MNKFSTIEYLKNGNPIQRDAHKVLSKHSIFEVLKKYDPILTGTIPIEINIPYSDLDIICYCINHDEFVRLIKKEFSNQKGLTIETKHINDVKSTIARFQCDGFSIEMFGQNIPTKEQMAYRHMIIEYEILNKMGKEFKSSIIELKKSGMKTERAFAKLLGLEGDPYIALLNYIK